MLNCGLAFAWFVLSLRARRSGLFGDVLRETVRFTFRLTEYLGLGRGSVAANVNMPYGRESGESGADGGVVVVALVWYIEDRPGLHGDFDSERRSCWIDA